MSAKDNCKDVKYPITAQNVSITCGGSLDFMGLSPLQAEDGVIPYRPSWSNGHGSVAQEAAQVSQTQGSRDKSRGEEWIMIVYSGGDSVVNHFMSFLTLSGFKS